MNAARRVGHDVPDLSQDGQKQPQHQQVADDPADVLDLAAKDEEGEQPADERGQGEAPSAEPAKDSHPDGPRASAIRRATSSRRRAATHSSTSRAVSRARRCAATSSSALARTAASRPQISRRTRAIDGSRSATWRIVLTYSALVGSTSYLTLAPGGRS